MARETFTSWATATTNGCPPCFFEVPQVGFVEALARETLLDRDQEWWKFGTAGAD